MTWCYVEIETMDTDIDGTATVHVIGPFQSRKVAQEVVDRFNRQTEAVYGRVKDKSTGTIKVEAMIRPFQSASKVIDVTLEWLDQYVDEDEVES